jgi:hypothetical protein
MSLRSFQSLAPLLQLARVLKHGTYLARYVRGQRHVNLYHLADEGRGFFVEVRYDEVSQEAEVVHSFVSSELLATYASTVELPADW